MQTLENKVALVTGGASGIGLATVRGLTALGAKVAVVDLDGDGARRVASEVGGSAIAADVSSSEEWPRIVSTVSSELGGLDAAHLNAGVTTGVADITELTDEQYRRIVGVNQDAVVFGVRQVVPELRQPRRRGDRRNRVSGGNRGVSARCCLHAHQACRRRFGQVARPGVRCGQHHD